MPGTGEADRVGKSEVNLLPSDFFSASLVWRARASALLCALLSDQPSGFYTPYTAPSTPRNTVPPASFSEVGLHRQHRETNQNTAFFCTVCSPTALPGETTTCSLEVVPFVMLAAWSQDRGFLCELLDRIHVCILHAADSGCVWRVMAFSFIIQLLLLSTCS